MAETRTARMNLPQYSSGGDSPGRTDFTDAFADIEARAAIDRRTAHADLPSGSPALVPAEYFQRLLDLGGGTVLRSLYRTDSGSTWRAASAWIPETLRVRPPTASPPAITAEGLRVDHPGHATPGLTSTWDGKVSARTSLVLGSVAETGLGRLSVGGLDAVPASVRARITAFGAERALEIKAGDADVTELLRLINSAGSNVLTVTSAGALSSTQGAAFGGISPAANASLTVAPQPSGAIDTGVLGYGQESASSRVIWQMNRFQPGSADAASIFTVAPNKVTIGRLGAWAAGAGGVDIGAPVYRSITPRMAWFPNEASIAGTSGFNPFPGLTGFGGFDEAAGLFSAVGTEFNNFGDPGKIAVELASYNSSPAVWTGDLLRAYQCEMVSGSPDAVVVSKINPQGQLSFNAPWLGSGGKPNHLRDGRQGIVHQCKKVWAVPGDYPAGLLIGVNSSITYTWPTMTVRSSSITQLEVDMRMELLFHKISSGPDIDRQVAQVRWEYQIAGGSWNSASAEYQEAAAMVADSAFQNAPGCQNNWTVTIPITAAAGTTFRLRMVVVSYPYDSTTRLRRADLKVRESISMTYAPSE